MLKPLEKRERGEEGETDKQQIDRQTITKTERERYAIGVDSYS